MPSTTIQGDAARPQEPEAPAVDPVTLEIIEGALVALCREVGEVMVRTAYSPIFSEGRDFSTALFDRNCEMVAQGDGCPAQLGALGYLVDWCIHDVGWDALGPRDVLLHNDVYRGGTHLPEFTMIRPIFVDGEAVGLVANIAHHVDVGGKSPGGFPGDATDVFQEGFRLPPVKLYDAGKPNRDAWRIYLSNVRTPHNSFGDLQAMHASLLAGERRFHDLVGRYGVDVLTRTFESAKDYSERRMRAQIEAMPDGVYRCSDVMEDDGVSSRGPFNIDVCVIVDGDELIIDFTGSAPQALGPINCPFGVTASACFNALLQMTDSTIPANAGCFRPVRLIAPPGTIVNVDYPGAEYGGNTETHNRIVDVIVGALGVAIPDRAVGAEGGTCCNLTYGGTDRATGEQFANYQWEGAGWGARATKDGNSAIVPPVGNSRIQSLEVTETRFPWRHEFYRLRPDSGGPGKFRGGLGTERSMRALAPIEINGLSDRFLTGAPGRIGGRAGGTAGFWLRRADEETPRDMRDAVGAKSPSKFANVRLDEGDTVLVRSPGGGGYGDPEQREAAAMRSDIEAGYVTEQAAEQDYGWTAGEDTD